MTSVSRSPKHFPPTERDLLPKAHKNIREMKNCACVSENICFVLMSIEDDSEGKCRNFPFWTRTFFNFLQSLWNQKETLKLFFGLLNSRELK